MMKVGLVGMPNAGKSSLFNALSQAGAEAANYPFTTIEPNVATVPVKDPRMEQVAATVKAPPTSSGTRSSSTTSRAWWPARPRARAWATSSWPTSASATRCCTWCAATPTRTSSTRRARSTRRRTSRRSRPSCCSPTWTRAERRHSRVVRDARSGDKAAVAEEQWLRQVIEALQAGKPARTVPCRHAAPDAARNLYPLTGKPVLFVANVNEGEDAVPERRRRPRRRHRRRRGGDLLPHRGRPGRHGGRRRGRR